MAEESERDKIRRLGREAARRKAEERLEAVERRMKAEADQEARDRKLDKAFEDEARALFGADIADIEEGMEKYDKANPNDPDVQAALRAFRDARKAAEGGFLTSGNPQKAKKILNQNKGKIKKAQEKTGSGCWLTSAILAVISLGVLGASGWGAVEIVSAMM